MPSTLINTPQCSFGGQPAANRGAISAPLFERCSAFFVGFDDREAILLSAWHCIDGQLSPLRQPTVLVRGSTVEVTIIDSGKAMDRDWLVMRAPRAAFTSLTPIRVSERPVTNDESLIAIGWGRGTDWTDIEASALDCPVISASSALTLRCGLTKGDSGGVVARQLENGQNSRQSALSQAEIRSRSVTLFPRGGCPICLTSDLAERARVHQCVTSRPFAKLICF